jgi:hypothetical protein
MYRVLSATVRHGSLILGVNLEPPYPDDRSSNWLEVIGNPSRRLRYRLSRIVFNADQSVSSRRIVVCEPPDFPFEELKGQLLGPSPQ